MRWEEIQFIVKESVEQFIKTHISPLTFVHNAEYLTTGFDDDELERIEQKFHDNSYMDMAVEAQNNKTEIKTFWSKLKSLWS